MLTGLLTDLVALLGETGVRIALAIAVVGGLLRGFSGFGGALVYMPVAAAALGPAAASASLLLFDGVGTLPLLLKAMRRANFPVVLPLAIGSACLIPAGAWMLTHVDPVPVRWTISVIIFLAVGALASGLTWPGPTRLPVSLGVGALAGFMGGLAQVSGPPVVLYLLGRLRPAEETRANLFVFFALNTITTFVAYLVAGLFTPRVLLISLLIGPVYMLGLLAGSRLFGLASDTVHRRVAFVLILGAGIAGMPVWGG
ncbi:sulfite exporter TauE/SafE family protein [Methylobrevis pamukkalensis]|uniref:Probable membrane transporter protein n=1 Tax=Methylobrevis pamukkalensis TaxID=1439726 RepID=A0A1E3H0G0_9HYPH|nr:sulfite exporter TauE/SafE family protein [Methylobrevis pamukkalensis]ODN69306.1 Sulfite exporter TauE/SafE [Methylobrevis pamukkalensis]